jgi:integrase/recombinase XerD
MIKEKINDYLNDPRTQSLATATLQSYSFALNDLQQFCDKYEITRMEEVEETLPRLAKSYRSRGISEQSIAYKFTCIKIFLKWAGFPSQYTFSISNTGKKAFKLKHARRWLSEEEIAQCRGYLFASTTAPLRNRLIVSLLIDTGCRARELSTLKGSDVELEKGTLFLSDSKTEPRPAFFSRETYELFVQYRDEVGYSAFLGDLFPNVDIIKKVVTNMLKALGLKNGADGRGPHVFRHYFASYLFFVGGMRIEEVATLMGDTVDTVRTVYLHCPVDVLMQKTREAMGWK